VPETGTPDRQTWDAQTPGFKPRVRYLYEPDLRRFVRYRIVGDPPPNIPTEGVAYCAPTKQQYQQVLTDAPAGIMTVDQLIAAAAAPGPNGGHGGYVMTLPFLPKLPAGPVLYEGSVVQ
jgi:hypothetical protein